MDLSVNWEGGLAFKFLIISSWPPWSRAMLRILLVKSLVFSSASVIFLSKYLGIRSLRPRWIMRTLSLIASLRLVSIREA